MTQKEHPNMKVELKDVSVNISIKVGLEVAAVIVVLGIAIGN
jgi:hypothetical protein